jgi:hypothetical protein
MATIAPLVLMHRLIISGDNAFLGNCCYWKHLPTENFCCFALHLRAHSLRGDSITGGWLKPDSKRFGSDHWTETPPVPISELYWELDSI